jgi:hypothetical protein
MLQGDDGEPSREIIMSGFLHAIILNASRHGSALDNNGRCLVWMGRYGCSASLRIANKLAPGSYSQDPNDNPAAKANRLLRGVDNPYGWNVSAGKKKPGITLWTLGRMLASVGDADSQPTATLVDEPGHGESYFCLDIPILLPLAGGPILLPLAGEPADDNTVAGEP